jgi:hypothetical protein
MAGRLNERTIEERGNGANWNVQHGETKMTLLDFTIAKKLLEAGISFEALLGALVMRSTGDELKRLKELFPREINEIRERYHTRSGVLMSDGVDPSDTLKAGRLERAMRKEAGEALRRVAV